MYVYPYTNFIKGGTESIMQSLFITYSSNSEKKKRINTEFE